jgi:hypothetical protein
VRLGRRLDAWAVRSRLNPYRLLVARHPELSDAAAFAELLAGAVPGAELAYDLPAPKWHFLHWATRNGFVLHGTNALGLDRFATRATGNAFGAPAEGLFASDDAIWPLYFATVRRESLRYGYINWALHVRGTSRYVFSIGADPRDAHSWTTGAIYLLAAETFERTGATRELISRDPPPPRAWLRVEPEDFPFRERTIEHGAGATPQRVVLRHALRLAR